MRKFSRVVVRPDAKESVAVNLIEYTSCKFGLLAQFSLQQLTVFTSVRISHTGWYKIF